MPATYLDIAGTYVGPGAFNYNVAAYPGGAVLFVNSAVGSPGAGRGRVNFQGTPASVGAQPVSAQGPYGDANKPLNSIFGPGGAMTYCAAGRGDVIVVAPTHVETLATGAAINIVDNVTIQGCSYGNKRPTFQFTNAATFIQPLGCCSINNVIFDLTGVAGLAKGFNIVTNGVQFNTVRIIQASVTNQASIAIALLAGADDFLFNGSEIDATAAAIGGGNGIVNPTSNNINRPIIVNSLIHGQFGSAPMSFLSTGTSELWVASNNIRQEHATTTFVIALPAGNTFLATLSYNDYLTTAGATATTTVIYNQATLGTGIAGIQNFVRLGGAAYAAGSAI